LFGATSTIVVPVPGRTVPMVPSEVHLARKPDKERLCKLTTFPVKSLRTARLWRYVKATANSGDTKERSLDQSKFVFAKSMFLSPRKLRP
jgi:hypothetical protein